MSNFPNTWQTIDHQEAVSKQGIMQESSTQHFELGTRLALDDGRVFRYALNGAVALAAGKFVSSPLSGAEREDTLTAAVAAGATAVTYTAVATITANEYQNGLLCVVDGAGQGLQYKIKSNDAITAASTGTINLYDPIITALDTTTDVMLVKSPFASVVIAPDQIVLPVGVPTIPVTASYYCWLQTWGIAPVLAEDSLGNSATERVCILGTTGGFLATDGMAPGTPIVGRHIFDSLDAASTDYHPIFLTIAP